MFFSSRSSTSIALLDSQLSPPLTNVHQNPTSRSLSLKYLYYIYLENHHETLKRKVENKISV